MIKLRKNKPVPLSLSKEAAIRLVYMVGRDAEKISVAETPRGGSERAGHFTEAKLATETLTFVASIASLIQSGAKIQGVK